MYRELLYYTAMNEEDLGTMNIFIAKHYQSDTIVPKKY